MNKFGDSPKFLDQNKQVFYEIVFHSIFIDLVSDYKNISKIILNLLPYEFRLDQMAYQEYQKNEAEMG